MWAVGLRLFKPSTVALHRGYNSMSSSSFSKTLQFITSVKLQELEKQRKAFQAHHIRVLDEAKRTSDPTARVQTLLDAARSWSGALSNNVINGVLDLDNLELWLHQANQDPGFEEAKLDQWAQTLETYIRQSIMRFDCARLFGNLFQEWLSSGDSAIAGAADEKAKEGAEFIDVGRKEKHEQLERFTSIVFDEKAVDTNALESYLTTIFSGKHASKVLEEVHEEMEDFCDDLCEKKITDSEVRTIITAFLSGNGSLSDENIAALREFSSNDSVLTELASVLTMRLASIDTWSWPAEGIPVQMRRNINGKYRAFTDPDIIDALLFHYLGATWQVQFRKIFLKLFHSKAWKTTLTEMPEAKKQRLERQLPPNANSGIEFSRHKMFTENFFLCTLSSSMFDLASYESSDNSEEYAGCAGGKSPTDIKRKLLHVLTTECELNTTLSGKHAVVCSDFEWFGPSLSHASILTILKFFGMTTQWSDFFKKWLAAPLRFVDEHGNGEVRVRKRGTPFNYTLSATCGEVVMFVMDFAVNQASEGLHLYRLHDDLWLFSADAAQCGLGWKEMKVFADLVGLTFNKEKTGSAYVGYDAEAIADLPVGDVRWGFLKFNSQKGRFAIDQAQVDVHIKELRRQLNATKSTIGWVNAYNKYMAFFFRNFGGPPAKCFTKEHLRDLLDTFARIQRELFQDAGSKSAVTYLRNVVESRFGIRDLPEGYFYFPIVTGGLELNNPFIELCSIMHETVKDKRENKDLEDFIKEQKHRDEDDYDEYKKQWERNNRLTILSGENYMTYDEYLAVRGMWVAQWCAQYHGAFDEREREKINQTPAVEAALKSSNHWPKEWSKMNLRDQWLVALYGEQLVDKFGALDVVDSDLIPLGMVELFKRSRIQLDQ